MLLASELKHDKQKWRETMFYRFEDNHVVYTCTKCGNESHEYFSFDYIHRPGRVYNEGCAVVAMLPPEWGLKDGTYILCGECLDKEENKRS